MSGKLAIVGASGKLGFATLNALLDHQLLAPETIVCTTSSESGAKKLEGARQRGINVRSAHWDDKDSWMTALEGCDRLFLISSSRINKDFNEAPLGHGREEDHFRALAAAEQVGVKHVYYTSLAFANPSLSRVMTAHERTEEYLKSSPFDYTIIREGLYNESWPLYLGHYDLPKDDRTEIIVAGDSQISWTSIPDLGLANALVLAAPPEEWKGKTFYLSQSKTHSMEEVAALVAKARGKGLKLRIVSRQDHERYYINERKMVKPFIEWWSKTYDALNKNECQIQDSTLEQLLSSKGLKPKPMEETVKEMFGANQGFTGR